MWHIPETKKKEERNDQNTEIININVCMRLSNFHFVQNREFNLFICWKECGSGVCVCVVKNNSFFSAVFVLCLLVLWLWDDSTIYRKFRVINFNQIKWVGWLVREMKKWISQFVSENVTKINIFNQSTKWKKNNTFINDTIIIFGSMPLVVLVRKANERTGACFAIPPELNV